MEGETRPQKWKVVSRESVVEIIKEVARTKAEAGESQLYKRDIAEELHAQRIRLDASELDTILGDTLMENNSIKPEDRRIKNVKVYDPGRLKEKEEDGPNTRLAGMFEEMSEERFKKTGE